MSKHCKDPEIFAVGEAPLSLFSEMKKKSGKILTCWFVTLIACKSFLGRSGRKKTQLNAPEREREREKEREKNSLRNKQHVRPPASLALNSEGWPRLGSRERKFEGFTSGRRIGCLEETNGHGGGIKTPRGLD